MKASLANRDPPILFVPGENDSVQCLSASDWFVLDCASRYPRFWTFTVPWSKQNEGNGHVLFGNPPRSLRRVLRIGPCLHNRWTNPQRDRGNTGLPRAKFQLLALCNVVISMAATTDMSSIACGSSRTDMAVLRRSSGPSVLETLSTPSNGILSLSYRSDNRLIALGGHDGKWKRMLALRY